MGLTLKEKEAIAGLTAEELEQRSKELRRKWQVDNREKIYEKKRQWVEANRESHNAKKREWHHANKEKINAEKRKRWAEDPAYREDLLERNQIAVESLTATQKEARAEYKRQYYLKNKERLQARNKLYREVNREQIRQQYREAYAANPKVFNERATKYRHANLDKVRAIEAAKNSRRRASESDYHTIAELHVYWIANGLDPKVCTYCDDKIPHWKRSEGDHVFPLSKGGRDALENLTPCCQSCNCSKRDSLLHVEWTPPNMREEAA